MPFTLPPIVVDGDIINGSWLTTFIRDNFQAAFQYLTAGDLTVGLSSSSASRLPVTGNAGWVLTEDPVAVLKMKWAPPAVQLTLAQIYPVGCIYTTTIATNPGTVFGFGTWAAFGAGRVLVGRDAGQTEFDTVEETGGAKTVTLNTTQIPSHNHPQDPHNHLQNSHAHDYNGYMNMKEAATGSQIPVHQSGVGSVSTGGATATNQAATATNQAAGGGLAHDNLQPYIVVYFWKRTA